MRTLVVEVQTGQYVRRGLVENGFAGHVTPFDSGGSHPAHRAEYCRLLCDALRGSGPIPDIRWSNQHAPVLVLPDQSSVPTQLIHTVRGMGYVLEKRRGRAR